jgi:hypothetical protein
MSKAPESFGPVADLLARVRARLRRVVLLRASSQAALLAAIAVAAAAAVAALGPRVAGVQAGVAVAGVLAALAAVIWALRTLRESPSDARLARLVEERHPELDERLVSAVGIIDRPAETPPGLIDPMLRDAARAASSIDPEAVVPSATIRTRALQALGTLAVLALVLFLVRDTARQSFDAVSLALFPSRVSLEVTPGNARIESGASLTVQARLVGNRAPVIAQLLQSSGDGAEWQPTEMAVGADGQFSLALDKLTRSFKYRVAAGPATSDTYEVAIVRAPRVARIDVEYAYPPGFGMPRRVETDGGDIYAPTGTNVTVTVHTDRPASTGRLVLGEQGPVELTAAAPTRMSGTFTMTGDNSYRVALADSFGLASRGDTEYFIRTLNDRPPEVHVIRPAGDRRVTPLEEVVLEAEALDDFGIASMEVVYAVRGREEKVVRLPIQPEATAASGRLMLYVEDLGVLPGDFVSYYVRARDLARGKPSSEARSDIFFLEVRPFEEEFTLAQSQAAMGGGRGNQQLDDLVAAQKEIIVATWKLDRRARAAQGARSEQDIRAVGRAEAELKTRVEEASSAFRQGTMRDPRSRPRGGPPAGQSAQPRAEEDAMTGASRAMGEAVKALEALKTGDAVGPEMEALNHLLRAQSDIKKRQIQQQAGGAGGSNRATQDLSSLFDRELARNQETNYERPDAAQEEREESKSAIDQIRELARRQDEIVRRQEDLARARMNDDERKRALEQLTRDQNELRQRAEQLAEQMSRQSGQQSQPGQQGQQGQQGQPQRGGQQAQGGQQGSQAGQQGQAGRAGQQMREATDAMRSAANGLRRENPEEARANASRALERLRELEQSLDGNSADGRRRALGDLQLEARQLADAERQLASEAARAQQSGPAGRPGQAGQTGQADNDALRRLAGEQERLAERMRRVERSLREQGGRTPGGGGDQAESRGLQQAAGEAAREVERQRLAERMQESAEALRNGSSGGAAGSASAPQAGSPPTGRGSSGNGAALGAAPQEIARALERLADRLASADRSRDDASRALTAQLDRAQELRDRLQELTGQMEQLAQQSGANGADAGQAQARDDLRQRIEREMADVRQLLNDVQRNEGTQARGGVGRTFEGQGMTLSAPGTEGFKQDYARWQELTRQVTLALDAVESTVARKLQDRESNARLAAGTESVPPAEYQQQVDNYFKALAAKKTP